MSKQFRELQPSEKRLESSKDVRKETKKDSQQFRRSLYNLPSNLARISDTNPMSDNTLVQKPSESTSFRISDNNLTLQASVKKDAHDQTSPESVQEQKPSEEAFSKRRERARATVLQKGTHLLEKITGEVAEHGLKKLEHLTKEGAHMLNEDAKMRNAKVKVAEAALHVLPKNARAELDEATEEFGSVDGLLMMNQIGGQVEQKAGDLLQQGSKKIGQMRHERRNGSR